MAEKTITVEYKRNRIGETAVRRRQLEILSATLHSFFDAFSSNVIQTQEDVEAAVSNLNLVDTPTKEILTKLGESILKDKKAIAGLLTKAPPAVVGDDEKTGRWIFRVLQVDGHVMGMEPAAGSCRLLSTSSVIVLEIDMEFDYGTLFEEWGHTRNEADMSSAAYRRHTVIFRDGSYYSVPIILLSSQNIRRTANGGRLADSGFYFKRDRMRDHEFLHYVHEKTEEVLGEQIDDLRGMLRFVPEDLIKIQTHILKSQKDEIFSYLTTKYYPDIYGLDHLIESIEQFRNGELYDYLTEAVGSDEYQRVLALPENAPERRYLELIRLDTSERLSRLKEVASKIRDLAGIAQQYSQHFLLGKVFQSIGLLLHMEPMHSFTQVLEELYLPLSADDFQTILGLLRGNHPTLRLNTTLREVDKILTLQDPNSWAESLRQLSAPI